MQITAQLVKQLRDMTGAGMMDCKKALVECDGDVDAAAEYLQVKGIAKAAKKAGRVAAEGLVAAEIAEDGRSGIVVEINCETDFVARNDLFQNFVAGVAKTIANSAAATLDEALALSHDGQTLEEATKEAISTIGENIQIRRVARFEQPEGFIANYLHAGSQIGVLVNVRVDGDASEAQREFGRDVAMHVAAMNPGYLNQDAIDEDEAAKQEAIFAQQVAEEGKPENIIPKIVMGKMNKWRKEHSLVDQPFVKDADLSVGGLEKQVGGVQIVDFVRYQVGEGIEKEEANLADEVAAQLKGDA